MKSNPLSFTGLLLAIVIGPAGAAPANSPSHTDPAAPAYSWPAADTDGDGVFDRVDRCPGTPPGVEVDQCGCPMASASAATIYPVAAYPPGVGSGMREELIRHGVIRLDMAFFRTDRADLSHRSKSALLEVADVARGYPTLRFEVSGHADSRGTAAHNQVLSRHRADEVRRFLIEEGGVRSIQLVARGYGESQLAAPEKDARGLQANRRVELRLLNPEAMPLGSKLERRSAMEALAAEPAPGGRGGIVSRQ